MLFRKKYQRTRLFKDEPLLESLFNKRSWTMPLRVLSYFIKLERVEQEELIKEIFGKIESDKRYYFIQKLGLTIVLTQIRKSYGVFIKTIRAEPKNYCKILNTKEEFDELLNNIDKRIENLQIFRTEVEEIDKNVDAYNEKVRRILNVLREKLE